MGRTRTTVTLDDDLVKRAKMIAKVETTNAAVTAALEQMVRRDALNRLAGLLGTDDEVMEAPPRRRPPDFGNKDSK